MQLYVRSMRIMIITRVPREIYRDLFDFAEHRTHVYLIDQFEVKDC